MKMDTRKNGVENYEEFDPNYEEVHEPEVDTLLLYLPGFKKDQLRVQLTGSGFLQISGQRPVGVDKWVRFFKQFPVSSNCDTNRISAQFQTGILYIRQPKLIIPAEKLADSTEEIEPSNKGEKTDSRTEPNGQENASDQKGRNPGDITGPGERTKPDNVSDKNPVKEATGPAVDKRAVDEKSDGAKISAPAAVAAAVTAEVKRPRKMMNVAVVILLVVGVGFYLHNKIRSSSSSNEAGEL